MTAAAQRSPWDAIVQRALLGTERTAASPTAAAAGDLGSLLGRLDAQDTERALLAAAALVGAYEAAGRLPARVSSQPVAPAMPESADLPAAPPRVARFLATMLGGVNDEVLPEWLGAVSARAWRVPTPMLPALLDAGRKTPAIRPWIFSALGARGRWLAARNDEWSYGAGHDLPADAALRSAWETGTPDERVAILAHLRTRDAALGRTLLESTWEEEAPSQRAALLSRLATGLGPADEPFLERSLDDRRQEVRRAAAELLRRLPTSALVARMSARADAALGWKSGKLLKRAELSVQPPTELDAALARDGVEKKPPTGMGERAWWLAQIVASVPPATWSERWKAAPDALISAAAAGDWAKVLIEGWAAAAVRYGDAAWAEPLLANGYPLEAPTPIAPDLQQLLGALPVDRREAFVARILREHPAVDSVPIYVTAVDHRWSEKFAGVVLAWMRKRIAAAIAKPDSSDWYLREMLSRITLRFPPSLADVTKDWPAGEDAADWSRPLERFIATLTFRRELHEELDR